MEFVKLTLLKIKERLVAYFSDNSAILIEESALYGPKVHLGCGDINLQGWINLDARDAPHVHIKTESLHLDEFQDSTVSEIYLCHVLEHFSFQEVKDLLASFHLKLHQGGILRISVPDFSSLVDLYNISSDLKKIEQPLMGGQDYEFNFHKSVFDKNFLSNLLMESGFSKVVDWCPKVDFGKEIGDWSTGYVEYDSKRFPISLNLKAIK
jgi:predicted SAM-dependent methyltransferase